MNNPDSTSQFEAIYQEIRARISLLKYQPGEMLSENRLAAEFGVSRTPMRRILRQLEFEGLVTSKQGVGTLVAPIDLKQLREVYALRIRLAELIGELSAPPPANADFAPLYQLAERCKQIPPEPDYKALARINIEFNDILVTFISNTPLRVISDRLFYQTARIWPQILPDMNWMEEVNTMCAEISRITEALRQGDMHQVGQLRQEHIANSLSRIQRYLGEGSY